MKWLTGCLLAAGLLVARADDLAKAKAAFAEKDKALNAIYAALKKDLPSETFAKIQEDQRSWVDYREYMANGPGTEKPESTADYWTTQADLTASRIEWLKAWKKLDQRKNWSGRYEDCRGGTLEIVEKDGQCWFVITVVRGPALHLGDISGRMRINGSTGWFETKADGEDKPTWLTFLDELDHPGSVRVVEENSSSSHGFRAYFRGTYLWTGELTAAEKKNVMEGKMGE